MATETEEASVAETVETEEPLSVEQLHKFNIISALQQNDMQRMGRLFQHRQAAAQAVNAKITQHWPRGPFQLLPPHNDKAIGGRRAIRREEILDNSRIGGEEDLLRGLDLCLAKVPVKVDLEMDGYKLRDSLIWCLNDPSLSVDEFASITCEDFELPAAVMAPLIAKAVQEQLADYQDYLNMLRMMGGLKEFVGIRGLVRLDITIDGLSVVDKFEWDLGEARNDPEAFAASYAKELALPAQFVPAVANDIHEQVYLLRRSLLSTGFHRDPATGSLGKIQDPDLAELVAVFSAATTLNRDATRLDEFTPLVTILEAPDLEKMEQSRDREARRKRRQAKAKKVESLSVRSPPKTMLTPLEYRGTMHRQLKLAEDGDNDSSAPAGRGRRRKN